MQAWATGIVCLYVCVVLFDWITGLHWLADFSLPMAIVGGVSLAIASHPTQTTSTDQTLEGPADAPKVELAGPEQTPKQSEPAKPAADSSISFTINKNARPG